MSPVCCTEITYKNCDHAGFSAKVNKPSIATDTSLLVVGHDRGVGLSAKVRKSDSKGTRNRGRDVGKKGFPMVLAWERVRLRMGGLTRLLNFGNL